MAAKEIIKKPGSAATAARIKAVAASLQRVLRVLLPLALGTVLLALGFFFAWQAWLVHDEETGALEADQVRSAAVTAIGAQLKQTVQRVEAAAQPWRGRREQRGGQAFTAARANRRAVHQRRSAGGADPALAGNGLVDHAQDGPAGFQQRDQRAEDRAAGHEADGAVDRVEHPLARRVGALGAIFLTDDAVARRFGIEQASHGGFGGAVGLCHRRGVGLRLMRKSGAKKGTDRRARRIGEAMGKGDVGFKGHGLSRTATTRSIRRRYA